LKKYPTLKTTTMPFEKPTPFSTPHLLRIAITGGIASGKSYICKQLAEAGHTIFYCDSEAKHIIRTHTDVRRELTGIVGKELYDCHGTLAKAVLAAWLCRGKEYSSQVDAVVHPRVAAAFMQKAGEMETEAEAAGMPPVSFPLLNRTLSIGDLMSLPHHQTLFMECALLFEAGFDALANRSVLVHVNHDTQLCRLMQRDHIDIKKAREWTALQMSEEEKLRLADHILPNDA